MPPLPSPEEIAQDLKKNLRGECRTSLPDRLRYSTDASIYQILPLALVIPQTLEDIQATMDTACRLNTPVTPRGGGTSLYGQAIGEGILLDYARHFDRILEVNPEEHWARVEPGVLLDSLNAAAHPHGLMYGPDPASSAVATMGGVIANNATGAHSIRYGMSLDHVLEVEVLLADNTRAVFSPQSPAQVATLSRGDTLLSKLYRTLPALLDEYQEDIRSSYPKTWRNAAGYNINRLLAERDANHSLNLTPLIVGSEGTLAQILSAKINLVPRPTRTRLAALHFNHFKTAVENVPLILANGASAVELLNRYILNLTRENRNYTARLEQFVQGDPETVLIVEFAGNDDAELESLAVKLEAALHANGYHEPITHCVTAAAIANVWYVRKSGLGLMKSRHSDYKPTTFIDDTAVPIENLYDFITDVERICKEEGIDASFSAHASAGCLHVEPVLNLKTVEGVNRFHRISEEVAHLAVKYHGTISGEHGEGLGRGYYNALIFGKRLHQAFKSVKALFDPQGILNPGKMLESPEPWDPAILRYSPEYKTPYAPSQTCFDFSPEGGYAGLVEMCNGQGTCHRFEPGLMCPSFRITRDERHSPRGRANVLRAALQGAFGADGFTGHEVYEALDLCLMCKACKLECPSLVDIARLKSEFLYQYQKKNGASLRSRLFAQVGSVTGTAALVPGISNWAYQNSLVRGAMDAFLGIDKRRQMPPVAATTFQKWFHARNARPQPHTTPAGKVILWDDCFTSYNTPEIGQAAVKILEAAGFEVLLVPGRKCCGRPMISKGFLDEAKRNAVHNISLLLPYVNQGIPIVGVEPSCVVAFRDEYLSLVPGEASRALAANTYFIEEFLLTLADSGRLPLDFTTPGEPQRVLAHGQCYQKSSIGVEPMLRLLRLLPNTVVEEIPSGCCGMAGSFGFEKEHYDLSLQLGEQVLFPAVRNAPAATIVAAGTSCRGQIQDGTQRAALHPIVLLAERLCTSGKESPLGNCLP